MPSDADTAAPAPVPPAPPPSSVFISYASEDRIAARTLRDTLTNAGLDVWYDENELTGGDAWDQKIRWQIRDCQYFMPIISATTEARKEGYFRREWRLACERSLDMADDVLFIVPIVIDDTPQLGARVPDKFLTVQWLRAPGGHPTAAMQHLIRRMLAGDHHTVPRASGTGLTRAPFQRSATPFPGDPPPLEADPGAEYQRAGTLTMPPFPAVPEKGGFLHGVKFFAEVIWWALSAIWSLFARLPKWGRAIVIAWMVLMLFSTVKCSRTNNPVATDATSQRPPAGRSESGTGGAVTGPERGAKKMRAAAERIAQAARDGKALDATELAKLRTEIAQVFGEGFNEVAAAGRTLLVVPFARPNNEEPAAKFAHNVFLTLYGRLSLDRHNDVGVTQPARADNPTATAAIITRARNLGATYVLSASFHPGPPEPMLSVELQSTADGSAVWAESYKITNANPTDVADKIGDRVIKFLPRREFRKGKKGDKGETPKSDASKDESSKASGPRPEEAPPPPPKSEN